MLCGTPSPHYSVAWENGVARRCGGLLPQISPRYESTLGNTRGEYRETQRLVRQRAGLGWLPRL